MAIEVFNRYEKKYLVPNEKAEALIKAMSFRMEPDAFNVGGETYKITNISYDRMAYFDREDKNFRVTFDTNIQTRRNHLRLEDGAYGEQLLNEGMMLMEVKIPGAMPLWFNHYLTELEIYPTSFSKYGTEYKRFLAKEAQEQKRKGELLCWNPSLQVQAHLA